MFKKQYTIISHLYSDMFEDIHETRAVKGRVGWERNKRW